MSLVGGGPICIGTGITADTDLSETEADANEVPTNCAAEG